MNQFVLVREVKAYDPDEIETITNHMKQVLYDSSDQVESSGAPPGGLNVLYPTITSPRVVLKSLSEIHDLYGDVRTFDILWSYSTSPENLFQNIVNYLESLRTDPTYLANTVYYVDSGQVAGSMVSHEMKRFERPTGKLFAKRAMLLNQYECEETWYNLLTEASTRADYFTIYPVPVSTRDDLINLLRSDVYVKDQLEKDKTFGRTEFDVRPYLTFFLKTADEVVYTKDQPIRKTHFQLCVITSSFLLRSMMTKPYYKHEYEKMSSYRVVYNKEVEDIVFDRLATHLEDVLKKLETLREWFETGTMEPRQRVESVMEKWAYKQRVQMELEPDKRNAKELGDLSRVRLTLDPQFENRTFGERFTTTFAPSTQPDRDFAKIEQQRIEVKRAITQALRENVQRLEMRKNEQHWFA